MIIEEPATVWPGPKCRSSKSLLSGFNVYSCFVYNSARQKFPSEWAVVWLHARSCIALTRWLAAVPPVALPCCCALGWCAQDYSCSSGWLKRWQRWSWILCLLEMLQDELHSDTARNAGHISRQIGLRHNRTSFDKKSKEKSGAGHTQLSSLKEPCSPSWRMIMLLMSFHSVFFSREISPSQFMMKNSQARTHQLFFRQYSDVSQAIQWKAAPLRAEQNCSVCQNEPGDIWMFFAKVKGCSSSSWAKLLGVPKQTRWHMNFFR